MSAKEMVLMSLVYRDLLVRHERTLHSPEEVATAIRKLQSNGIDKLPPGGCS
jgi:hypothetical protein